MYFAFFESTLGTKSRFFRARTFNQIGVPSNPKDSRI
jgi:hypothetical protein